MNFEMDMSAVIMGGESALAVNAIDEIETQMVSKSVNAYLYQNWGEYYNWDDTVGDVVRDNRSNYTINGEPAQVITVPSVTVNDYDGNPQVYESFLGLESATWTCGYQEMSTYAMKVFICKDSNVYNNNYQYEMTVSYDEEEATVTTTIDTPLADILAAIDEGKDVVCKWDNRILRLAEYTDTSVEFSALCGANYSETFLYRILYTTDGVTAQKRRFTSYIAT